MDTLKLGQIIEADREAHRDAIHIAVAPVVAAEKLSPGDHVGIDGNGDASESAAHVGIVDPFLKKSVRKGERFWLYLYPGSITSLRHDWTHPQFAAEPPAATAAGNRSASEQWLREFAEEVGVSYGVLMDAAESYLESGDYHNLGRDTPDVVYEKRSEFWTHYAALTGKTPSNTDATFFSCAC